MMSRGFSIYLDLLRFGAALVVLLSHFAYPKYTDGRWLWVRELNLGSDAVVVFFVLSGFVIALVADRKPTGVGGFGFDRMTRLVSVALPALLVGYALDRFGAGFSPEFYAGGVYNPLSLGEMLLRGLTFSNEFGQMATRMGTNGAYWSLSYEAVYYALFAIAFYMRGPRRVALLGLGAVIAGVNILLLMPCWLLGVALYHRAQRPLLPRGLALAMAILPLLAYAVALMTGVPDALFALTGTGFEPLRFSNEPIWNWLLALLFVVHLTGMMTLVKGASLDRVAPAAKWLAGGSFSIYLVHFPVLVFIGAMLPGGGWGGDALLFSLIVIVCLLFAQVFERTLPRFRVMVRVLTAGPSGVSDGAPAVPPSAPAR